MSIETLLSKLEKVKSTGNNRWTCSCPAHDDRSPSMHIKLDDYGKILINCKAGCGTYEILQSIGLDWEDIMPEKALGNRLKPQKKILFSSEALAMIQYESRIVMASAYYLRKNKELSEDDLMRLEKSMQTINKVIELTK
jgi:hypothetical protein